MKVRASLTFLLVALLFVSTGFFPATGGAAEVTASVPLELYGFVKTDFIYNDGENAAGAGNYLLRTTREDSDSFHATSRATRLGLKLDDGKINGRLEVDFLASVGDGGHAPLRLRHAFINLDRGSYEFLVGQTWHLTPLELPATNNDLAFGYSGALWHRVPQARFTYHFAGGPDFAFALTRPTRNQGIDSAIESGSPMAEMSLNQDLGFGRLKLAGAFGRAADYNDTQSNVESNVELINLGYNFNLADGLKVNGQLWKGKNLWSFLGGIGQMGLGDGEEVEARGGFVGLSYSLDEATSLNTAYGVDDPEADDLTDDDPTKNTTYFVNCKTALAENLNASFEVSQNKTDYKGSANEQLKSNHYQTTFKYSF